MNEEFKLEVYKEIVNQLDKDGIAAWISIQAAYVVVSSFGFPCGIFMLDGYNIVDSIGLKTVFDIRDPNDEWCDKIIKYMENIYSDVS